MTFLILFGALHPQPLPITYIEKLYLRTSSLNPKLDILIKKMKTLFNAKLRVHLLLRKPQHSKRLTLSYPVVCRVQTKLIKGWQQIEKLLLRPDLQSCCCSRLTPHPFALLLILLRSTLSPLTKWQNNSITINEISTPFIIMFLIEAINTCFLLI